MARRAVIPLRPRPEPELEVVVEGPEDPAEADALRRAILRDFAELAVDLLAEGRLPPRRPAAKAGER